jgi:hypothetical protein
MLVAAGKLAVDLTTNKLDESSMNTPLAATMGAAAEFLYKLEQVCQLVMFLGATGTVKFMSCVEEDD